MAVDWRTLISPNRPWVHLLYLGLFLFNWTWRTPSAQEAGLSLAAVAGFSALYVVTLRRSDWTVFAGSAVAVALGLAFLPTNPGGAVFIVFAAAMLGWLEPSRPQAAGLALAALAALAGGWVTGSWLVAVATLGIGAMATTGAIVATRRMQQMRDAEGAASRAARHATDAERQRIARDLHDLLGHTLSVVTLKADIAARLLDDDPERTRTELQAIQDISRTALAEVREAVTGLRDRDVLTEIAAARTRLEAAGLTVRENLDAPDIGTKQATVMAMAVREAVTNILRHADASSVGFTLAEADGLVALDIVDDGRGGADRTGGGLSGLAARLAEAGGALDVRAGTAGTGTHLTARLPVGETDA